MTLAFVVLGLTPDTNYDACAGVAGRPVCEQGPFHSAHAVMILWICSCIRYLKGIRLDVKLVPNLCTKEPPSSCMCHAIWSDCFELS